MGRMHSFSVCSIINKIVELTDQIEQQKQVVFAQYQNCES